MLNKTYVTKAADIQRQWFIVDADGQSLGRIATKIATILRGKHKTIFTPGLDTGDFVVVINAEKVTVTGNKDVIRKEHFQAMKDRALDIDDPDVRAALDE